jgi:ComF family protein
MVLALVLPTACPVCGRAGPAPCGACWRSFRPAPVVPPPDGLATCRSLLLYEGAAADLIARLKYRNARAALRWLVTGMAALVASVVAAGPGVDVVTWAPTTRQRRRERGFDQAELLARALARELRLPARRLLMRMPGPPQTGRRAGERRAPGAVGFVAAHVLGRAPPYRSVLVVDDVVTTGATLTAAATALTTAGVLTVNAVTSGRTPLKVREGTAD